MTSFTLLTFVPRTIYGMCINSILSYTSITSHAHGVKHLTPSTYTLRQVCENQVTQRNVINMFAH